MPPVFWFVASACTASATRRTPWTPTLVGSMKVTDPKRSARIACPSAEPSRSPRRPTMYSCPTRCASLNRAKTTWAQDVPVVDVDVGITAEGDGSGEVELDDGVGLPPDPHAEPTSSRASVHPRARTGLPPTSRAL